jgi:hypothetical protein
MPPDKSAWETFGRPTGEFQASSGFHPAMPRINHHSTLDRLKPPTLQKKKKRTVNKELRTNTQQRDGVAERAPVKGGGTRS